MEIKRLNIRQAGSCNFCDRGKLAPNGMPALVYPYTYVTQFTRGSNGAMVNICDDCFKELKEFMGK